VKWSWRVGRIAGIDIFVHATFPLLFGWIALVQLRQGATRDAVLFSFGLIIAVFAIVVLHELGHALTARRFGVRTRDITLLPIGGVARLERMPREPKQELLIALAGPAVNLALAVPLYLALAAGGGRTDLAALVADEGTLSSASFVAQLLVINVWLAVFNLIPAFPLDGGRALRALFAMGGRDYTRATVRAASIGRVFALLFGFFGLFVLGSPFLVLIALFVWLSAAGEASAVQTTAALEGVPLTTLMITDVRTLSPDDTLARAAQLTMEGFQHDFPVVHEGALVGLLSQSDLVRGLGAHGSDGAVRAAMRERFESATADLPAEEALRRLARAGARALPVVRGRELLGVLTSENVMEYLMLRGALGGAREP
jgi:Zn-dependent protease/CBS domain-containing protein